MLAAWLALLPSMVPTRSLVYLRFYRSMVEQDNALIIALIISEIGYEQA